MYENNDVKYYNTIKLIWRIKFLQKFAVTKCEKNDVEINLKNQIVKKNLKD